MYVYRCTSNLDLNSFFNGVDYRPIVRGKNTHKYENNISYVHFFRYSQFTRYIREFWRYYDFKDRIFVVADIDSNFLNQYVGYGFYSLIDFSIASENIFPIPEYAIPISLFRSDYVVSIDTEIPSIYGSDYIEYSNYFKLLEWLGEKFNYDFDLVGDYLNRNDLDELLTLVRGGNYVEKKLILK